MFSSKSIPSNTSINDLCKGLQETIKSADGTLEDVIAKVVNGHRVDTACLVPLENAIGDTDAWVWSEQWAKKLEQKDQEALDHSDRRRTLLFLLRKIYDLGFTKEGGIAEGQLDALASLAPILLRIFKVVLPMDRANALYCLHNTLTGKPGKHWYALEHWQLMVDLAVIPEDYVENHTMNRRYLAMVRSEVFNADDRSRLMTFLTPTLSPKIPLDQETLTRAKAAGVLVL